MVARKKIDDFANSTDDNHPDGKILKHDESNILFVPPGYANGLKALSSNAEILVFSDYKLAESLDDKIRIDKNLWLDWSMFS